MHFRRAAQGETGVTDMRIVAAAMLAAILAVPALADSRFTPPTGLELRLKQNDGVPFAFDHADEEYFSPLPFMTAKDFAREVIVRKSKNPNTPDDWEIVLSYTDVGRAKFRAVADADRTREFCLIFQEKLYHCEAFPPVQKGLYDKGIVLSDRYRREKAEKIAGNFRRAIANARR
jgi:hypothetical protein